MSCIQNSCIGRPTLCNAVTAGSFGVLALTLIVLSIIGSITLGIIALAGPHSWPLNAISFGSLGAGLLILPSFTALCLDLTWIAVLCNNKAKEQSAPQPIPPAPQPLQLPNPALLLPNPTFPKYEDYKFNLVVDPTKEEVADADRFSKMASELIIKVFSYLNYNELVNCCRVSKLMQRLIYHPSPNLWDTLDLSEGSVQKLICFDDESWANRINLDEYGLSVKDAPLPDKRYLISFLKECLSALPIEQDEGITYLIIPKGLTLKKILRLARSANMTYAQSLGEIAAIILHLYGDVEVKHTYPIVITNAILRNSKNLSASDQEERLSKIGCKMPRALELATLLIITSLFFDKRFYFGQGDYYEGATRCAEKRNHDGAHLICGNHFQERHLIYEPHTMALIAGFTPGVGAVYRFPQKIDSTSDAPD